MSAKNKTGPARKIKLSRIFNAPRELVFAAWTKPRHLKQWSAPHGFMIPVSRGVLKPKGKWTACMVTPEGEKLWLGGHYQKIVPNRLLVFTHAWKGEGHETIVTVQFEDHPRGTKMTFEQSGFGSVASRDGHKGGWTQGFEKLGDYLKTQLSQ